MVSGARFYSGNDNFKVNAMSKGQDSKKAGKKTALLTPKEKKLAKKVKKDAKSKGVNDLG